MPRPALLLLALPLLLAACGRPSYVCSDPLGCVEIAPSAPLRIAVLTALSGPEAPAGEAMLAAVQSAVEESGGLLGHEIELIWEGTDCTENSARRAAARLALTPNLLAVIGPSCPADAAYTLPVLADAGLAVLAPLPDGGAAFRQLASALEASVILLDDGALLLPRSAFQERLENQP